MALRFAGVAALVSGLLLSSNLPAQPQRYELGRRLRAFEETWERTPGAAGRKQCVEPLNQAVTAFFGLRLGDAGRAIDEARFALAPEDKPTPARRFAVSLALSPAARLLDANSDKLRLELKPFYNAQKPATVPFAVRIALLDAGKELAERTVPIEQLPLQCDLPINRKPLGDLVLRYEVLQQKEKLAHGSMTISFVDHLAARLADLTTVDGGDDLATEQATVKAVARLLSGLAEGKAEETDYPAARMLGEAEQVRKALQAKTKYYDVRHAGGHWVTLVSGADAPKPARTFPMRLMVPEKWENINPPPLVIALHGAGGSENLFFDGYGAGKVVKLCRERGWMLVAPRVGFGLQLAPMLDALHARYPFDRKKVFLIGHSMGAALAVQSVSAAPKRFAGVVALGGSGVVKPSDDLKKVPFFIGIGTQDFALAGARRLKDRLSKVGIERLVYRELEDVEHLGIVQQTLAEAFAFFDAIIHP